MNTVTNTESVAEAIDNITKYSEDKLREIYTRLVNKSLNNVEQCYLCLIVAELYNRERIKILFQQWRAYSVN